jgi:outer membrane protein assembly factor BamB
MVYLPAVSKASNSWYGINAETGEVVWSQKASRWTFNQCLTEKYLVIAGSPDFKNLDAKTGRVIWEPKERHSTDRASCSEKFVYSTSSGAGSLILVQDLKTGQSHWLGKNPRKANLHDVLYNSETGELLASYGENFIIFDPQTGREKNSFPKAGDGPNNGMWERGPIYVLDRGELFLERAVINAKTGEVIHRRDNRFDTIVPPTVTTDTVYVATRYYGIIAYNRANYSIKWMYLAPRRKFEPLPLHTLSQVAILDEIGYVIFSDATLRALDLTTGEELGYWQLNYDDLFNWPVCSYPSPFHGCTESARAGLAVSENTLFASFGDGTLYAFAK